MMQVRRRMAAAWKNKAVERRQCRVERIDSLLDPRNLPLADPQRLHFAVLPFGTAEVAPEVEEIILNVGQHIANDNIVDMQQSYADNGVRLVDAAIGRNARVELRQSRPVTERSAAVIAGACVNPIEFHGV